MVSGEGEVEHVMVGGPAYLSNDVFRGDLILGVDGNALSGAALVSAIKGNDTPGSCVTLTLKRGAQNFSLTLTRIPTADVVDKRCMFELFTKLYDRAKKQNDPDGAKCIQETLTLWEKILSAHQAHQDQLVKRLKKMQDDCSALSEEMSYLMLKIIKTGMNTSYTTVDSPSQIKNLQTAETSIESNTLDHSEESESALRVHSPPPAWFAELAPALVRLRLPDCFEGEADMREAFQNELRRDLASASNQAEGIFVIQDYRRSSETGGWVIDLEILPSTSGQRQDSTSIALGLQEELSNPQSSLRKGKICRFLQSLTVLSLPPTSFSVRKGRQHAGIEFSTRSPTQSFPLSSKNDADAGRLWPLF
jgi:hypothetical protein